MLEADITAESAQETPSGATPGWVGKLLIGLVIYVVMGAGWMLTGFGGEHVIHYVGLLADSPACLAAVIITIAAARNVPRGALQTAWRFFSIALGLYFIATVVGTAFWLTGRDPFPGIADVFFVAFYPAVLTAVFFLIRAAAVRVPWVQLALDATIFVVGFGAFFWFLVIRPAASGTEIDFVKQTLSQTYVALNCVVVLAFGVLLLAGAGSAGRRIALLLLVGFAMMFLGDILWALAKVGGYYLPG
jgi:hypothetical protein